MQEKALLLRATDKHLLVTRKCRKKIILFVWLAVRSVSWDHIDYSTRKKHVQYNTFNNECTWSRV